MKTKKLFLSLLAGAIIMFSIETGKAQSYQIGTNVINVGVGFGYALNYGTGVSSTPVITASYEHGLWAAGPGFIGLGLAVGYQGSSYSYSDGYGDSWSQKWTATSFGIRGLYHLTLSNDKLDLYGGLQLTYVTYGYSYSASGPFVNTGVYSVSDPVSNGFYPYIIVGGRYYFTTSIGAFAELGYDISYFKIGVSFKF